MKKIRRGKIYAEVMYERYLISALRTFLQFVLRQLGIKSSTCTTFGHDGSCDDVRNLMSSWSAFVLDWPRCNETFSFLAKCNGFNIMFSRLKSNLFGSFI